MSVSRRRAHDAPRLDGLIDWPRVAQVAVPRSRLSTQERLRSAAVGFVRSSFSPSSGRLVISAAPRPRDRSIIHPGLHRGSGPITAFAAMTTATRKPNRPAGPKSAGPGRPDRTCLGSRSGLSATDFSTPGLCAIEEAASHRCRGHSPLCLSACSSRL